MLKFKGVVTCNATSIARLAGDTQQALELVREMSGGACVITQYGESARALDAGLDRLHALPSLEYVNPDRTMQGFGVKDSNHSPENANK